VTSTLHIVVAMKPLDGNFTSNAIKHGVAGLNIDGCRIGYLSQEDMDSATPQGRVTSGTSERIGAKPSVENKNRQEFSRPKQIGRFPANVIHDGSEEVVRAFPFSHARGNVVAKDSVDDGMFGNGTKRPNTGYVNDTGSASRFFKQVKE